MSNQLQDKATGNVKVSSSAPVVWSPLTSCCSSRCHGAFMFYSEVRIFELWVVSTQKVGRIPQDLTQEFKMAATVQLWDKQPLIHTLSSLWPHCDLAVTSLWPHFDLTASSGFGWSSLLHLGRPRRDPDGHRSGRSHHTPQVSGALIWIIKAGAAAG